MPPSKPAKHSRAAILAGQICAALGRDRIVPRFVDTYVVEQGRYGLQVHAVRYRELLETIEREALLALTTRALAASARIAEGRKPRRGRRLVERAARMFRGQLLAAITRQYNWSAGDALEFQSDLALYEKLGDAPRASGTQRLPGYAKGPFVDRCAFLLDPSMMEQARGASAKLAMELERLANELVDKVFRAA